MSEDYRTRERDLIAGRTSSAVVARLKELRLLVLSVGLLFLGGCTLPTMTRADMSAFDRDHYECYREASFPQSGVMALPAAGGGMIMAGASGPTYPAHNRIGQELYRLCMRARGYREAN